MECQHIRIEKAENGYKIEVRDPELVARNHKSDEKWVDPDVAYVFSTLERVQQFLTENLETLLKEPGDEYDTAFQSALKVD